MYIEMKIIASWIFIAAISMGALVYILELQEKYLIANLVNVLPL